jgi:hypothetical protein
MLIEMSELKDQLKRYSSLQMRSKSSDAASGSVARSTSIGVGNDQRSQGGETTEENDAAGPSTDDANWAKIRQQQQQHGVNSSKAKRKSKYR